MSSIQMGTLRDCRFVLNQKHADRFLKHFERFVVMFGLRNYQVHFYFPGQICENSRASMYVTIDGGQVQLSLAEEWDMEPTDSNLARTAFHEALELMLVPLEIIGQMRYVTQDRFEEEVHKVVRTLENTFFEMMVENGSLRKASGKSKV